MPIVPAGNTNLAAIGVPNVYVQIVPPNPLLNGVPTDIVGVVGVASWGPNNSPTTVGSLQELVSLFGNPLNATYDMGTQVYNAIQQGANNFRCVRVTDGTDVAASIAILDTSSPTKLTGATLTAIYTGTNGNNINAVISSGSAANSIKLTIYMAGGISEVFDSITGSGVTFWSNLVNAVNLGQNNLRGPSQLVTAATANFISSVSVTAGGSYTALPTLGTSGPGSGAVLDPIMQALSGVEAAAGSGYAVNDTITLTGGTSSQAAVLTVNDVQLVSIAVNAGGSGYSVGDFINLAGGTFSSAGQVQVATVGAGGSVSTITLSSGGNYSVTASSFTQGSTTGIGTGATFNTPAWGVKIVSVTTPGSYSALPTNPVSQGSTSGSGTGATFTMNWALHSVVVASQGTGYTSASALTISGSGGATGTLNIGSASAINNPASYVLSGGTNGNAGVTDSSLIGSDSPVTIGGVSYQRTGMYALRNTGASIGVLADQTDTTYWTNQVTFGGQEGMYMLVSFANNYANNLSGEVSAKTSAAVANYNLKVMHGDWELMNDPFNNVTRYVSPLGFTAGILATQLPSGSSLNKIMNGVVATNKSALNQNYSYADLLQLETAGIDLIANQLPVSPNSGVFGVRLGINSSANIVTNGDNYTRMVNFLAATFNTGLGLFIGLPQTPTVQAQAAATLQTFLQNLVSLGMIGTVDGSPAFQVILNSSNNPPSRVALGFMQADVQVVLFSIIQRFVINLQAGQSVSIQVLPAQLSA